MVADSLKRSREAATLRPMPEVEGWCAVQAGLLEDEEDEAEEERRDRGLPARGEVTVRSPGAVREEGKVRALSAFLWGAFLRI